MDPCVFAPLWHALPPLRDFIIARRLSTNIKDADDAQKEHVGQFDQQIDLADGFQRVEKLHTKRGADQTSDQEHTAHSEIHRLSLQMREHPGKRACDDLVCFGRNGDCRRNADEKQQWGHQEAPADAEHAGQDTHNATEAQQKERVYGHFGDWQVDLHKAGYSGCSVLGLAH